VDVAPSGTVGDRTIDPDTVAGSVNIGNGSLTATVACAGLDPDTSSVVAVLGTSVDRFLRVIQFPGGFTVQLDSNAPQETRVNFAIHRNIQ
jgi:hypothetical protein